MINQTDCYLAFGINWGQTNPAQDYLVKNYPELVDAEYFEESIDLASLVALNEGIDPLTEEEKFGNRWSQLEQELELEIIDYGSQRAYDPEFFLAIKSTVLGSEDSFSDDPDQDNYLGTITVPDNHFSSLNRKEVARATELAEKLGIFSFSNPTWKILSANNGS